MTHEADIEGYEVSYDEAGEVQIIEGVAREELVRLPARVGQTYRQNTHMSVEAYPPDGPQISPRQGS